MIRVICILICLGGCTTNDGGAVGVARQLFQSTPPPPAPRFTRALNAGAPQQIVAVIDRDAVSLFVREATRNGQETWISSDLVSLHLQGGLVTGTRGFGHDLMTSDATRTAAAIRTRQPAQVTRFASFLDGDNQINTRSYICTIVSRGARQIDLGNGPAPTTLMAEDCINPDTAFVNLYWVTAAGRVVQSRQWVGPRTGALSLRHVPANNEVSP